MEWINNNTVLFIGGSSNTSANTICIRNLASEMLSRGYKVWIIAAGDEYITEAGSLDGVEIWHIPDSYYTKLSKQKSKSPTLFRTLIYRIVSVLRHLFLLPFYPITAPIRSYKVFSKAYDIVEKNDIRLVVSTYNSYDNIYAGMKIKSILRDSIKVISYHLDLRTVTINSSKIIRNYVRTHVISSITKENRIVDKMLIPYSGKSEMEKITDINFEKVKFVGFPVFLTELINRRFALPFKDNVINVSYVGTLSLNNRDPRKLLNILEQVSLLLNQDIIVHFWGSVGDLEHYLRVSPIAKYHGLVDNCYVRHIMDNSDFLLNIGNYLAYNMLPSKVFSMFATGKPIINAISHPQDCTRPFFNIYSNNIDINLFDIDGININSIAERIRFLMHTPLKDTTGLFEEFKPSSICDIILQ